jgi:hypothetical protein
VHYGTAERPSLSQAAARTIAQTRHVYLEQTDRAGTSWPMRDAFAIDLEQAVQAKRKATTASMDEVRQAIIAAKRLEEESGGVAVVSAEDKSYHENWALAYNHCGAFYEYGTERLVVNLTSGKDLTVHALETEASLNQARSDRCKPPPASGPAALPHWPQQLCTTVLEEIQRDQRDGRPRPQALTRAAACVLDSRHRTMAARIVQATKAGEKPFVVVGRGHLVPGENLIDLLGAQGLSVRRID